MLRIEKHNSSGMVSYTLMKAEARRQKVRPRPARTFNNKETTELVQAKMMAQDR